MSFGFFPSYYKRSIISALRGTESNLSDRHYLCVECDKEFLLHRKLNKHIYTVHLPRSKREASSVKSPVASKQDTPFENTCPLCSLTIGRVSLKRHMITDHNTEPYLCTRCNSRFYLYSELLHHKTLCNVPAKRKSTVLLEERRELVPAKTDSSAQIESEKFQCRLCPSSLPIEAGLFSHMLTYHNHDPIDLTCSFCSRCFMRKSHLGSHLKIHKHLLICSICGIQCYFSEQLRDHTRLCGLNSEEAEALPNPHSTPNPLI